MRARSAVSVFVIAASSVACRGSSDAITIVASMYPLAWAARSVGGPHVEVTDLTPHGAEAHDTTLTAAQRADLQTSDVVVYLGDIGFQPDVERAVGDAEGTVVDVSRGLESDLTADPHVWLDPVAMTRIVDEIRAALVDADGAGSAAFDARARAADRALDDLDRSYREALVDCDFTTFVATHEAFGYLADRYGLEQIGILGLVPETEPTAEQVQAVEEAIDTGEAAPALFFEDTPEGADIADAIASDAGVPAFPLGTLEADPGSGDYVSVMRANLRSLTEGLGCATA